MYHMARCCSFILWRGGAHQTRIGIINKYRSFLSHTRVERAYGIHIFFSLLYLFFTCQRLAAHFFANRMCILSEHNIVTPFPLHWAMSTLLLVFMNEWADVAIVSSSKIVSLKIKIFKLFESMESLNSFVDSRAYQPETQTSVWIRQRTEERNRTFRFEKNF